MKERGVFITFEGGDGSGKTTLIRKLEEALSSQGIDMLVTREPGGSRVSESIRRILLDSTASIAPLTELLLYLAARTQHIAEKIKPAIDNNQIVFCDRFNDSTIVYQGIARDLGTDFVKNLCEEVTKEVVPDLTIYLDVSPDIGLKRVAGVHDRMESESKEFHEDVRSGYLKLAEEEPDRIHVIDSSQTPAEVFKQALTLIQSHLDHV
jgi:dTMP kinase